MRKDRKMPTISANSIAEFTRVEEALKKLPDCIFDQIEKAKADGLLDSIKCTFIKGRSKESKTYIPDYTTQIHDFGDYVGIYSGEYFFEIPNEEKGAVINYILTSTEE